jgi:hypothetical protein
MEELDRAMQLAYALGAAAPTVSAIRLKCELKRLIVKQEETGKPGEFDSLSDDEVRARREALATIVKASKINT